MVKCMCRIKRKASVTEYIANRVIGLYFGCECRRNRIKWTREALANTFGITVLSVDRIIKRFRANGLEPVTDGRKSKDRRGGRARKLSTGEAEWLVSDETLNAMRHLNLRQRSELLRSKYQMEISWSSLRNYYRRSEVRYRKPDIQSCSKIKRASEILRKQIQFVVELQ